MSPMVILNWNFFFRDMFFPSCWLSMELTVLKFSRKSSVQTLTRLHRAWGKLAIIAGGKMEIVSFLVSCATGEHFVRLVYRHGMLFSMIVSDEFCNSFVERIQEY